MIIDKLIKKAKNNKKTIVLVEYDDIRVLKAIEKTIELDFANIVLVGDEIKIKSIALENNIKLDNINIINPNSSNITTSLIDKFYEIRKEKGLTYDEAKKMITENYLYFGAMLVYLDYADGMVAGAVNKSSDVLRAALQTVKTAKDIKTASSFFIIESKNSNLGSNGLFIFSDCGMNLNPTSLELVEIANSSRISFENLIEDIPKIAFLSHSTNLSSKTDEVLKVRDAVNTFKEKYPDVLADGEMQLDAAIIPEVSESKFPLSKIKGEANILIFPDIDSGNIAYKIAERFGNCKAYGPISQGLKKPINDLSRGCNSEDIVGVIAITCIQSNL